MHQRVLPVSVGGSGAMTHEMCAEFGAAANFTGDGVVYGVEYGDRRAVLGWQFVEERAEAEQQRV